MNWNVSTTAFGTEECVNAALSLDMGLKGIMIGVWSISPAMPTAIIETVS
jgi:hypothetical protein